MAGSPGRSVSHFIEAVNCFSTVTVPLCLLGKQCMRVPIALHHHHPFMLSVFSFQPFCWVCSKRILCCRCVSLMANDAGSLDRLFATHLALNSLCGVFIQILSPFLTGLFVFLLWVLKSSLYIPDNSPQSSFESYSHFCTL